MPSISLRAHFDGCAIQLDEPYPLPPNSRLLVTVLEPAEEPLQAWSELARAGLAAAYGDEEPDYSPEDLKNP
jgi:hypothetical protein